MRGDAQATQAGAALTVEELRAVVADAAAAAGRLTARGFGTYASPLPAGVRVVDTRPLGRIVDYDPADMTITVEAGCRLDVLGATLAEQGQWLPIDVPWPDRTTVGGMIAAGLFGPLRATFGTLRDQIIGLGWIGGDGRLLASGGRVVKNVAGYDLMKLHVGGRGRFGVLTEATLRVRAAPAREITLVGEFGDPATAARRGLAFRDVGGVGWSVVTRIDRTAPWTLSVGLLGPEAQLGVAADRLRAEWRDARTEDGSRTRAAITRELWAHGAARISMRPTEVGARLSSLASNEQIDTIVADVVSGMVTHGGARSEDVSGPGRARDPYRVILEQVTRAMDPAGLFDLEAERR